MNPAHFQRRPALSLGRRDFLRAAGFGLSGLGAGMLVGCGDDGDEATTVAPGQPEPPPEVTRIRFAKDYNSLCAAPQYVARDFLAAEGFTEVEYRIAARTSDIDRMVSAGDLDMSMEFAAPITVGIDTGRNIKAIAGIQGGCNELIAGDSVRGIDDLAGKRIAIAQNNPTDADYLYMASILDFVGVPAERTLVGFSPERIPAALKSGEVDAVLAYPPVGYQLRDFNVGRVILSSMSDPPWSQYYCCLLMANGDFVNRYPIATKRALRAVLKGADLCVREPEQVARFLVDNAYIVNYTYALSAMKMLPYHIWRDYDPEDSLRFYALRLNQAGRIKSTPDQIIKQAADWRFFNELKRELGPFDPPPTKTSMAPWLCDIPADGARA